MLRRFFLLGSQIAALQPSAAPPASPTRWRVNVTENQSGNLTAISELQLYTTEFGTNQCTGGTASADSVFPGGGSNWVAANAFDQNSGDGQLVNWASTNTALPHWLEYEFATGKEIVAFGLQGRATASATQTPKDIALQYHNGAVWVDQITLLDQTFAGSEFKRFVKSGSEASYSGSPHGSHTYWRVVNLEMDGSTSCCIMEMEFRATPSGADQATGGTASASTVFSSPTWDAANAFANNGTTSGWHTTTGNGPGSWLKYQFASPVSVAEVTIQGRDSDDGTQPKMMVIQYSDDDTLWTTAWQPASQTGWTASEIRTLTDPEYV